MYLVIYKNQRDLVSKLIFYAIGVVVTFAATLVGLKYWQPQFELVPDWNNNMDQFVVRGGLFTIFFLVSWAAYFWVISKLERNMLKVLSSMLAESKISKDEYTAASEAYFKEAKFIPFGISMFLYCIVIAPF